jgi:hypothetical protein
MSRVGGVEAEKRNGDVRLIEISRILVACKHLNGHETPSSSAGRHKSTTITSVLACG